MIQNESNLKQNLVSTKGPATPSHQAIQPDTREATDAHKSEEERLDVHAMEAARMAQNRIHKNEERTPGNTLFTK